jgi:hypothetical protein
LNHFKGSACGGNLDCSARYGRHGCFSPSAMDEKTYRKILA